jgi:hypothetical protein
MKGYLQAESDDERAALWEVFPKLASTNFFKIFTKGVQHGIITPEHSTVHARRNCKKKQTVNSYPPELRGFAQNRFGGQQAQNLRTYGGKFGAAGPVRRLNSKERRAIEADLRERGMI